MFFCVLFLLKAFIDFFSDTIFEVFEASGRNFSKTNALTLLKFCTLLQNRIDYSGRKTITTNFTEGACGVNYTQ